MKRNEPMREVGFRMSDVGSGSSLFPESDNVPMREWDNALKRECVNPRILIMGIGNYLMADEGLGVHLAQHMGAMDLPEGVDVLDGGTGGFHLLEYFEQYPHVILVDATLDGRPPGTIRRIKPRFASDFPQAMSTHDIGLKDLVGALQLLGRMPEIDLFVVSIRSIQEQGIELTEEISAAIARLEAVVLSSVEEKLLAVV